MDRMWVGLGVEQPMEGGGQAGGRHGGLSRVRSRRRMRACCSTTIWSPATATRFACSWRSSGFPTAARAVRAGPLRPPAAAGRPQPGLRVPRWCWTTAARWANRAPSSGTWGEGTPFVPQDRYACPQILQWQFFEQSDHEPYVAVARFWLHYRSGGVDPAALAEKQKGGYRALDAMEKHLAGRQFLVEAVLAGRHLPLPVHPTWRRRADSTSPATPPSGPGSSRSPPSPATCPSTPDLGRRPPPSHHCPPRRSRSAGAFLPTSREVRPWRVWGSCLAVLVSNAAVTVPLSGQPRDAVLVRSVDGLRLHHFLPREDGGFDLRALPRFPCPSGR